ncbi:erythrocyte membrane protein 1 (PfEMP1), putative [Plasmodium sp.]|nr:erythrocyte membrane protein 1 (PfEMP1), putative [Plasmodium sp.]
MGKGTNGCEYDNYCYQKEEEGGDPSSSLCEGKKGSGGDDNDCDIGKGWKTAKSVYETRGEGGDKSAGVDDKVFLPTRRQCICTQTLKNVTTRDELITNLMKISVHQGYNLGKYYKGKETRGGEEKKKEKEKEESQSGETTYDVSPCNAMKYSFYDLRDIILGYDQLETNTETSLKQVFESGGGQSGDGKPGSEKRQEWWDTNKECVWKSMLCGYRRGKYGATRENADQHNDLIPSGCTETAPDDDHFPLPKKSDDGKTFQFLRWFAEWSEDFCKQKKTQKNMLSEACKCYKCKQSTDTDSGDTCDSCDSDCKDRCGGKCKECEKEKETCTSQCKIYQQFIKDWKSQYQKQRDKYTSVRGNTTNHPVAKNQESAHKYLSEQLQNVCPTDGGGNGKAGCNCMGEQETQSESDMPPSLEPIPNDYTDKCSGAKEEEGDSESGSFGEKPFEGGTETPDQELDQKKKGSQGSPGPQGAGGDKGPEGAVEPSPEASPEKSPEGASSPKKEDSSPKGSLEGSASPDGGVWETLTTIVALFAAGATAITDQAISTGSQLLCGSQSDSGDQAGAGSHTTHGSESDGHSHGSQEGGGGSRGATEDGGSPGERGGGGGGGRSGSRVSPPQLSQILGTALPLSVGIALKKPKKKPSTRPFYRVVELPEKVSKKYDPPYRGKRYIYVEGNGEDPTTDTTTTASDSDTGSEYEEIFVSRTPKYKTLIDIILEPRNRDNRCHTHISHNILHTVMARDIYTTHTYDTGDIQDISMYQKNDTKNTSITCDIQDTSMYQKNDTKNTSITHDIPSDIPTNTFVSNMLQRKHIHNIRDTHIRDTHIRDTHIRDTHIHNICDGHIPDISIGDIPTNKPINDNGLNQLKQGFIPNILRCTKTDLSNENTIDDKIFKNTYPYILQPSMDQKPFITSIQDRYLHGGYDHSYNINWNVPTNINMETNTVDDPKYVAQKCVSPYSGAPTHIYTGTDLISDSLSDNIDIYSEILKRKEKEIYSGNTTKYV